MRRHPSAGLDSAPSFTRRHIKMYIVMGFAAAACRWCVHKLDSTRASVLVDWSVGNHRINTSQFL